MYGVTTNRTRKPPVKKEPTYRVETWTPHKVTNPAARRTDTFGHCRCCASSSAGTSARPPASTSLSISESGQNNAAATAPTIAVRDRVRARNGTGWLVTTSFKSIDLLRPREALYGLIGAEIGAGHAPSEAAASDGAA